MPSWNAASHDARPHRNRFTTKLSAYRACNLQRWHSIARQKAAWSNGGSSSLGDGVRGRSLSIPLDQPLYAR